MSRLQVSLGEPPEDLQEFPRRKLGPETELCRVVRKDLDPWWFNSTGAGRFDLAEPDGTCYLATDELAAILEVVGPDRSAGMITIELLARRRLHRLRVPTEHSLADLTNRRAAGFGVTLEVSSTPRYGLTQAWARMLFQSAHQGLFYFARHDPGTGRSVALFGPSGEREDWHPGSEHDLEDPALIERLWHECRIRVAARPRQAQIPIIG